MSFQPERPISPTWITTQIGAREHYLPPIALARRGQLDTCFTDFWAGPLVRGLAPSFKKFRSLANRYEPELDQFPVVSFNAGALWQSWREKQRQRHDVESLYDFHRRYGEWFGGRVRESLQKRKLEPGTHRYFGFNTGCLETLEHLRPRGVFSVVQQIDPARTEQRLILEETARWPGWQTDAGHIPESYFQRLEAEWRLCSLVVVNSEWSRKALIEQGVSPEKMVVIPLAYERPHGQKAPERTYAGRPLRVLWLGSVILRKGIAYLIEAARLLRKRRVEFIIAGPIEINLPAIPDLPDNVKFLGRVQRNDVPHVVAQADVNVLPTISDGFALTQLEAMAQGLPVITTPNCGAVVTHGQDGFIVPIRDANALVEAIARLDDDRELVARLAAAALKTVERFSIAQYGERLVAAADAHQGRSAS